MEINYSLNPVEWALLACMAVLVFFLIRYYVLVYVKVIKYKCPTPEAANTEADFKSADQKKPVSVVLSGKNQYEYLRKNLAFWLEQKYPDFEVIVVYEDTDEDVTTLLRDFARRYPRLVLINANQSINFFDEQKFSLSIGAKSAHNEYVIMTHPQFRPASDRCIDHIQATFKKDTQIVIGNAVFSEEKKRVCSYTLYRTVEEALQYLGFAIGGHAYTGRQCLIAYRKSFFLEHQGFSDSYALDCVEFDRFKNRVSKPGMVGVQISPESRIKFTSRLGFGQMMRQDKHYRTTLAASEGRARKEIKTYNVLRNLYFWLLVAGAVYFALFAWKVLTTQIPLWALCFCALFLTQAVTRAVVVQKAARRVDSGSFWFLLPLYSLFSLLLQMVPVRSRVRQR